LRVTPVLMVTNPGRLEGARDAERVDDVGRVRALGLGRDRDRAPAMSATPRPWYVSPIIERTPGEPATRRWPIFRKHGKYGHPADATTQADADLIVRAVNSFDALVEALTQAKERIRALLHDGHCGERPARGPVVGSLLGVTADRADDGCDQRRPRARGGVVMATVMILLGALLIVGGAALLGIAWMRP